jgi:hypothetical protein
VTRSALNLTDRNPWLALVAGCLAVWALLLCSLASAQDTTTGKVFDWDLFEDAADTGGSSGAALTVVGSPTFSGERVSGFSDANYLQMPDLSPLNSESSYTIVCTVNAATRETNKATLSLGGGTAANSLIFYSHDAAVGAARVFANGASKITANPGFPATGSESHVAIVVTSAASATLYVNAENRGGTTGSCALPASVTDGEIGRWYAATGQSFHGSIGQIKIFDRALSQPDVAALMAEDAAELAAFRAPAASPVPAILLQLSN